MTALAVQVAQQLAAQHAGQPQCLASYSDQLPDTEAALALLWSDLCKGPPPVPWFETQSHSLPLTDQQARHLLLFLIHLDGWKRVKQCQHSNCQRIFIDASNPVNRRWCDLHSRHHSH